VNFTSRKPEEYSVARVKIILNAKVNVTVTKAVGFEKREGIL
jgi:hypothetical protein